METPVNDQAGSNVTASRRRDLATRAHAAAFFTVRSGVNMMKFPNLYRVGFCVRDALRKRISNSLTVRDAARRFRYRSWSSQ